MGGEPTFAETIVTETGEVAPISRHFRLRAGEGEFAKGRSVTRGFVSLTGPTLSAAGMSSSKAIFYSILHRLARSEGAAQPACRRHLSNGASVSPLRGLACIVRQYVAVRNI